MGFFKRRPPTFSDAVSKTQFLEDWAGEILVEAGCDSTDHNVVYELANTAADGAVRQGLKAVAESYQDHDVVDYLEALALDGLVYHADAMYKATIDKATAGRPGPVLRERISAFNGQLDQNFTDLRPNYVEYARVNYK